jgi:hypothetical protein
VGLSRINPLFLDSTKPIGDKVVTNVELLNVTLRDGESVYFEVSDHFGFVQRFALQKIETKKSVRYTAEVWLKYQHQIQYRFLMVAEGEEILTSATREIQAGHVISEKWEPCFKEATKPKKEKRPARLAPEIKKTPAKSLGKPLLLDQIKSLIDDLL